MPPMKSPLTGQGGLEESRFGTSNGYGNDETK